MAWACVLASALLAVAAAEAASASDECSGFGTWTGSRCLCFDDFTGPSCQYQISTHSLVGSAGCSSHGDPDASGGCSCHMGWGGPRCTRRLCVHGSLGCAAGASACVETDCVCDPGWQGGACDKRESQKPVAGSEQIVRGGGEPTALVRALLEPPPVPPPLPRLATPSALPAGLPSQSAPPRCPPATPAPPACQHGGWRRVAEAECIDTPAAPPGPPACLRLPAHPPPPPCECPPGSGWTGPLCEACAGPQDCAHGGVWDAAACACACPPPWRAADHCSTCDPAVTPRECMHGGRFDEGACACRRVGCLLIGKGGCLQAGPIEGGRVLHVDA